MRKKAIAPDVEPAFSDEESAPSMVARREAMDRHRVAKLGHR